MNKLLINEPPLQVLPTLAVAIGLNEAIFVQQLHYWIENKKVAGKVVDGRKWIYNSVREWREDNFPFWSDDTIGRAIKSLIKQGILLTRNDLNNTEFDRTKWYTIDYGVLNRLPQNAAMPPSPPLPLPQVAAIEDSNLQESYSSTETTISETTTTPATQGEASLPPRLSMDELKERSKQLKATYIEVHGPNVNHGAVGKGVQQLAKANCTPEELRQCYEWLKLDPFWEFKPILPQTIFNQLDEFRRYRDKATAMNGADPSSPKLQQHRQSFDNFADYHAWADVHDKERKSLYEGVTVAGNLIKRPRPQGAGYEGYNRRGSSTQGKGIGVGEGLRQVQVRPTWGDGDSIPF